MNAKTGFSSTRPNARAEMSAWISKRRKECILRASGKDYQMMEDHRNGKRKEEKKPSRQHQNAGCDNGSGVKGNEI